MTLGNDKHSGVEGGVTAVTSTVGNGVGGLLGTVGGVVGAAGRGRKLTPATFISFKEGSNLPLLHFVNSADK